MILQSKARLFCSLLHTPPHDMHTCGRVLSQTDHTLVPSLAVASEQRVRPLSQPLRDAEAAYFYSEYARARVCACARIPRSRTTSLPSPPPPSPLPSCADLAPHAMPMPRAASACIARRAHHTRARGRGRRRRLERVAPRRASAGKYVCVMIGDPVCWTGAGARRCRCVRAPSI